jgi:hypothetical protein
MLTMCKTKQRLANSDKSRIISCHSRCLSLFMLRLLAGLRRFATPWWSGLSPRPIAVLSAVVLLASLVALAQQKPGTLPGPSPQAPAVANLFPPGGQRGTTVEVEVQGRELADALGLLATVSVQATIVPDKKEPASRALVRLQIPKEVPLGVHLLRLTTRRGVSNPVPFCVDELPEIRAASDHRTPAQAQKIPVPCVVSGRLEAESSHYYRLTLQAGQRICFEVDGQANGLAN